MTRGSRRGFGGLRKLPSGRWQAYYTGPDTVRHQAPDTFRTKAEAEGWLADERDACTRADWIPPRLRLEHERSSRPPTFEEYSLAWVMSRDLKPATRKLYEMLLDRYLMPHFGPLTLDMITPIRVRTWYASLAPGTPTSRAHAYSLLRTIMNSAVRELDGLTRNPCMIPGAGSVKRVHEPEPATLEELEIIVRHMPERLRLAVLLAAWTGLRQGEILELRRGDIVLSRQVVRVRRAVTRVAGQAPIVGLPKSQAGIRDVTIPPHVMPAVHDHLKDFVGPAKDALLFVGRDSGEQLATSTLYRWYYPARTKAGRDDLRWHDLRHTGATMAAVAGATLPELMNRMGHSTVGAAMRYQHVARNRDAEIAARLSEMARGHG